MSGSIQVPVAGSERAVFAGPFKDRPILMYGVKLAPEVQGGGTPDVLVNWQDFGTPDTNEVLTALKRTLRALAAGQKVYVGCRGGIGRTGTFLALLVKATRSEGDPVARVRNDYLPGPHGGWPVAVETPEQEAFVRDFDMRPLRWTFLWLGVWAGIGRLLRWWA